MTEAKTSGYDMVIVGAGPAGLAAGIAARKCGLRAVILEKGESAGPLPRGEGIHRYPLLDEVLGMDFWEKDCYRMDCSVVYHSPNDLHTTRKQGTRDIFFFEWRRLIERLVDSAQKAGVEIIYNAEVLGPIEGNDNSCRGLRYRFEQKDERLIYGKAVLACDGYNSVLGRHYGIDYRTINCPMVKCIADNTPVLSSSEPDLQFYLIGSGDLSYAPDIPPCVVYAFPIGGRKMELGLMLRMGKDAPKGVRIPDPKELMTVWGHLKKDYPGFSRYFQGAQIEYEYATAMSNARMVKEVVPARGIVLIGDSAGFVDPFGSSGIYSGIAMATFWVNLLAGGMRRGPGTFWGKKEIGNYLRSFRHSGICRHINKSYARVGIFEWYLYRYLRTAKHINRRWGMIKKLLSLA